MGGVAECGGMGGRSGEGALSVGQLAWGDNRTEARQGFEGRDGGSELGRPGLSTGRVTGGHVDFARGADWARADVGLNVAGVGEGGDGGEGEDSDH